MQLLCAYIFWRAWTLTDEQQAAAKQIESLIFDARDALGSLNHEGTIPDKELYACRDRIEQIKSQYNALKAQLSGMDEMMLQRKLGRKVIDLRRDANWLPRRAAGDAIPMSTDKMWKADAELKGTAPGEEYTGPGTGPKVESYEKIVNSLKTRVGGSIDAWCGACKMMREHTISAMLDDKPKKVVCETCGAQHNYRTTPARGKKPADGEAGSRGAAKVNPQISKRKEAERTALQQELVNATDVRSFKRRARYKAGEIIEHPEYGRGKIENVLRGSLLVRFRTGLRPLDNF